MKLCSRCHKNPAVIYITKMEGDRTTNEGLCLACAKELGIAPINDMIEKMGITDSDIENLNSEMSEFMENMGANPENLEAFHNQMIIMLKKAAHIPFRSAFCPHLCRIRILRISRTKTRKILKSRNLARKRVC